MQHGLVGLFAPVLGSEGICVFGISNVTKQVSLHDRQDAV